MYYITTKLSPACHQMTLEEFLYGTYTPPLVNRSEDCTRTYEVDEISKRFRKRFEVLGINIDNIIANLKKFNDYCEDFRKVDRHSLYREFYIPKESGGWRKINAPCDELKVALRNLKTILENEVKLPMYHTSAFAYIKRRSVNKCVDRHQANVSKWFAKFDLSNFFGSTTLDFVLRMFSMIYPLSAVMEREDGREELTKALELAFLDGGLPQGTPISPFITNVMMSPMDYRVSNSFRDFQFTARNGEVFKTSCVYTRYADDFQISCKYLFPYREAERVITDALEEFDVPFRINQEKTRFGSASGSNWILGIMLNGENKKSIGYKNRKYFNAAVNTYARDKVSGINWSLEDVQILDGKRNWYHSIAPDDIDEILKKYSIKYKFDVLQSIKNDLKGRTSSKNAAAIESSSNANYDGNIPF